MGAIASLLASYTRLEAGLYVAAVDSLGVTIVASFGVVAVSPLSVAAVIPLVPIALVSSCCASRLDWL